MHKEKLTSEEVNDFLNRKCGVLGLSGVSSDFRDIQRAADAGNYRAQLALDVFTHDVKKYVGAYSAILDGVDAIIFTAGLGENSPEMRKNICSTLGYLGVNIDEEKNQAARGQEVDVSKWAAKCRVLVIPTNEELMIALDTKEIIKIGRASCRERV